MRDIPRGPRRAAALAPMICLLGMTPPLGAQQDLRQMSLEELMAIEVTTVSRAPESSMGVPAAVFVITDEDIRRSGAASLPELLRLAPGMQVARIDAGKWSVGTRGFADRLARSMLVLIDGRAVYSPLFAGTYWETQHVPLEDIDRIEVIRGPGGTLWGANAVNGIVSIVTKPARRTQGLLLSAARGSEARAHGTIRYGGALGRRASARAYASGLDHPSQFHAEGPEYDGWRMAQGGFRFDWDVGSDQHLTAQGDLYSVRLGQYVRESSYVEPFSRSYASDTPLSGGNVLARWTTSVGDDARVDVQTFYDRSKREEYPVSETRETLDVDAQIRHDVGGRHRVVWGAGYQVTSGEVETAPISELPNGSEELFSVFAEDEVSMASERLRTTLGVKLEHNEHSGWEVQPSVRAAWLPDPTRSVWASVTRAVRRPSRVERSYGTTRLVDPSAPTFIRLIPNPDFRPEKLTAYEAGYRARPGEHAYLTVSAFYNQWDDLLSTEVEESFEESDPPAPDRLVLPVSFRNGLDGTGYGTEVTLDVRAARGWRAVGHYAFLRILMTPKPGSTDITQESRYEGGSPRHQVRIQNTFSLPGRLTLDWHLRHVSELPDVNIPSYTTSDVRLAWDAIDGVEIELVGRDLHHPHHYEWPGDGGGADVGIVRSVYVGLVWRQ